MMNISKICFNIVNVYYVMGIHRSDKLSGNFQTTLLTNKTKKSRLTKKYINILCKLKKRVNIHQKEIQNNVHCMTSKKNKKEK